MGSRPLVICPVFNEEKTLRVFYEKLKRHYKGDILFIDDGSTDGSKKILSGLCGKKTLLKRHHKRQGYGATLISGIDFALRNKYATVVTMDVDLQHDPSNVHEFLTELKKCEVVLGSRYIRIDGYMQAPLTRMVINKYISNVLESHFSMHFSDPFCGFRAYRDSFLKKSRLYETSYGFALEVLLEIIRLRADFKETPVEIIYTGAERKFFDGLNDPAKRLKYYLNVIMRKKKEIYDEKTFSYNKPTPR